MRFQMRYCILYCCKYLWRKKIVTLYCQLRHFRLVNKQYRFEKKVFFFKTMPSNSCAVFSFLFFQGHFLYIEKRAIMDDIKGSKETIRVGLVVAVFLEGTKRYLQAIELCKECLILLNNSALDIEEQFTKLSYRNVHVVMFKAYFSISDYTNAERHARKLLPMFRDSGEKGEEANLSLGLAKICFGQSRFLEGKELCERAIKIMKAIGERSQEAVAYGVLANILKSRGEYLKATEYHEKALAITMETGDKRGAGTAYGNLGNVFYSLGEYKKAKEYFEKALETSMEIGDRQGEGVDYGNLGSVLYSLGKYKEAKDYFEKALAIRKEIGDRQGEGVDYGNLGNVFYSLGEYKKAKEYYEKALAIRMEICDRQGEGANYSNLGGVFDSLGEYKTAKEYYEKALAISMEIGDRQGEGVEYGDLGNVFYSLGQYQKAKEYHEKALAISMEIGHRQGEGANYSNLGGVFDSLGEYKTAKEYYEKALAISMEIGDRQGEGVVYCNFGNVFYSLGEYKTAKEYHEKALAIRMEIGDREGEGVDYGNLGKVFYSLGEYKKAKEYHEKALAISVEIGYRQGEGANYGNLGNVFYSIGEYKKAKEYHDKALAITMEIGHRKGEGAAYGDLGGVFYSIGKYKNAKEYYEKQLAITMEIGERKGEGAGYDNVGSVFYSLGDYKKAKEYHEKALAIRMEIGDRGGEAICYHKLGNVYRWLGEYDVAEEYLEKARSISSDVGNTMNEFQILCSFSRLKLSQSKFQEAYSYLYECIEKYEKMRNSLKDNDQFKISLLETCGSFPYKLLSEMLCASRNPREALYVEELRRARVLADSMAGKFSVENHISANPESWFGIEKIVNKERNCAFLYISYYDRDVFLWLLKTNGHILFREAKVDEDTLRAELVVDLDGVFQKSFRSFGILPKQNCEDRSLSETMPMSLHDESEAPLRGEETQNTERRFQLCSKLLIAPVADLLTEPEIIIVPDRSLYRVPFAALRDQPGGEYLSETFRIRFVPSLSTLKLIQDSPEDYHSQTGALVVGDPKVGEVLYKGSRLDITPLPCARKEAEMVGRLLGVMPLLGEHATKEAVLQAINSVSLIHFAAHGNAERGEICLSPNRATINIPQEEDYLLTMSDISQVQLRAKLVVLSCCHSGRGEIKQEGVIGIARAFLGSGARSVLVALWAIEDTATEQLMSGFYEHLVSGESASESLHQAMKWLRSNGFPKVCQWAPFMLIGDNVTFDFKTQR